MMNLKKCIRSVGRCVVIAAVAATSAGVAQAQIEITEIMYHPNPNTTAIWEWVEIRNTSGSEVDMTGWVFGDRASRYNSPSITGGTIPAGGVAVIYNSVILGGDTSRFTNAWGNVQLIPVNIFPGMNNASAYDRIGLWSSYEQYNPGGGTPTEEPVWANAVFEMDYTASGMSSNPFPAVTSPGGRSIAWTGSGNIALGSNWVASTEGDAFGAYKASQTSMFGAVNSTDDAGTPGYIDPSLGTPPASSLLITEIMYNPASNDAQFEWVEILNNTGSTLDFETTPYVFDDWVGAPLTEFNVTSGSIPNGGIGVLVNSTGLASLGVTLENLKDAWEPAIGSAINFIPVTNFPALNNSNGTGDVAAETIGLWDSLDDHATDIAAGRDNWTLAKAQVTYFNNLNDFPDDNGDGSIYLNDLSGDPSVGTNWTLTGGSNDAVGAAFPEEILKEFPDNPGNDIGSPGFVPSAAAGVLGDYNDNGTVDAADYVLWRKGGPLLNDPTPGVQPADYDFWRSRFGANSGAGSGGALAAPEPTSAMLMMAALAALCLHRRK